MTLQGSVTAELLAKNVNVDTWRSYVFVHCAVTHTAYALALTFCDCVMFHCVYL